MAIQSGAGSDGYLAWVAAREARLRERLLSGGGAPTGLDDLALLADGLYLQDLHRQRETEGGLPAREMHHYSMLCARWKGTERSRQFLDHLLNPPDPAAPLEDLTTLAVRERFHLALSDGRQADALEALGFLRARKAEHDHGEVEYFGSLYRLRGGDWRGAIASAGAVPTDSPDYPKAWYVLVRASAHLGDVRAVEGLLAQQERGGASLSLVNLLCALLVMNGSPLPEQLRELLRLATCNPPDWRKDPYAEEAASVLLPIAADFVRQVKASMTWAEARGVDVATLADDLRPALDVLADEGERGDALRKSWLALMLVMVDLRYSGLLVRHADGTEVGVEGVASLGDVILSDIGRGGTGLGPAGSCLLGPIEWGASRALYLQWLGLREELGEVGLLAQVFHEWPEWFDLNPEFTPLLIRSLAEGGVSGPEREAAAAEFLLKADGEEAGSSSIPAIVPREAALILKGAEQGLARMRADGQVWADAGPIAVGIFGVLEATLRRSLLEPALLDQPLTDLDVTGWTDRERQWLRLYEGLRRAADGKAQTLTLGQIEVLLGKVTRVGKGSDGESRAQIRRLIDGILTSEGRDSLCSGAFARMINMDFVGRVRNAGAHGRLVALDDAVEAHTYVVRCLLDLDRWIEPRR
jgi:hypothetical protein